MINYLICVKRGMVGGGVAGEVYRGSVDRVWVSPPHTIVHLSLSSVRQHRPGLALMW